MKGHSLRDQMKTKNFYAVIIFIGASSISLWLFNYPTSSFRVIVTKTHKQISNIKNLPSDIQKKNSRDLKVDPVYLNTLGLSAADLLAANKQSSQNVRPVIATAIEPGKLADTLNFIISVKTYMTSRQLVLVDLGLSKSDQVRLQQNCNQTWNCLVHNMKFDKYPSHVQYLDIKSYKPICIQELLTKYGAVIWVDSSLQFMSSNISHCLEVAKNSGFAAWTIQDPTSSLTHPKMFQFFKTKPEEFFFHRAVESSHLIIYNTDVVRRQLMLPWVKCALLEECINPTGAQNVGCNYFRKPRFNYSGCHHYDMSALNVVLGLLFNFDISQYALTEVVVRPNSADGANYTTSFMHIS